MRPDKKFFRGNANPLLILVIIIIIAGVGYIYLSRNNLGSSTNPYNSSTGNIQSVSSLNYKNANEFFPDKFNNFQIDETAGYKVNNLNQKEYKRPNDTRVAHLDQALGAHYDEVPQAGKSIDPATGFGLTYAKISNKDEVNVLSSLLDADFNARAQGFKKIDLPLQGIKYWAVYRDVPDEKAAFAGDASIIFPDALVYLRVTVSNKYSQEQFQNTVKDYVNAILDKNTQFVTPQEIH